VSERETQRPGRLPGLWTLLRDILTFFGGWAVIFLEVSRPEVRESVLLLAGSAIAVPGAAAGAASVVAAVTGRRAGTGESPSSSPDPAPSASSPP
jgi:hypothetical protein